MPLLRTPLPFQKNSSDHEPPGMRRMPGAHCLMSGLVRSISICSFLYQSPMLEPKRRLSEVFVRVWLGWMVTFIDAAGGCAVTMIGRASREASVDLRREWDIFLLGCSERILGVIM